VFVYVLVEPVSVAYATLTLVSPRCVLTDGLVNRRFSTALASVCGDMVGAACGVVEIRIVTFSYRQCL